MEPQDLTRPLDDAAPSEATIEVIDDATVVEEAPAAAAPRRPPTIGQLRRERRKLWDERQDTVYHVGGLAVDLHRRGMLDEESLITRRAEIVQALDERILAIDEQLSEIDVNRKRHRQRMPAPSGYCMSCGAPFLPDAAFCSRCGSRIHVAAPEDTALDPDPSPDMPTQVIEPDTERGHTALMQFDDQRTQVIRHHFEDDPR